MHTVYSFSIEAVRFLPFFVFLLQGPHGCIFGGAVLEHSAKQHVDNRLAQGDHRKTVDEDAMPPSSSATFKNKSNPISATPAHHRMAKSVSVPSFHVDGQMLNDRRLSEVSEVNSTGNLAQTSSGQRRLARNFNAQHGDSKMQRVMRSESSRRGTRIARGKMAQRGELDVQALMRSESSKRGNGVLERKTPLSPMQVFNDGHTSLLPVEKATATIGFDGYPSGSTGKQAFVVDQNGDAGPDSELVPRRDEHVLGKGGARASMAHHKNSNGQSLMRSENSKRSKGVLERKIPISPMQLANDSHMSSFPAEKAFDGPPSGSTGKQTFIVDQNGHAAPELGTVPRRDEHVLSKGDALRSMPHHKHSKGQSLMRSESSKRSKGLHERNIPLSPVQLANDGHTSSFPAEKARAIAGFDNPPADGNGKQTFIVDQSGHTDPDLETVPRRDEHVLGKGDVQSSTARHKHSKGQSLMRSAHSRTGRGVHEHKLVFSHVHSLNDGHVSFFPVDKAPAITSFDSPPSGSTGKQTFTVDKNGHAGPELEISRRRDENVLGKIQNGQAEQWISASEYDGERARPVLPLLEHRPAAANNVDGYMTAVIIVLLLITIMLLLDLSLNGRIRARQEVVAWSRRPRLPSAQLSEDFARTLSVPQPRDFPQDLAPRQ